MDAMRIHPGLAFRIEGLADPAARAGILDLLRDIFDLDFGPACALWPWHEQDGYRAYSWMDGGVIAANVSSRPLPLIVGGRAVAGLQIHAVATRPAYRGRGLFKDLMIRVLDDADGRVECMLLYSATPELYRPFGFRPLVEHRFRGRLSAEAPSGPAASRDLSLSDPDDLSILRAAFARRQPVSRHLGLVANGDVFVANALAHPRWRLTWLPDVQALVVWERAGDMTRLHDVVAAQMPSAARLVATLGLHEAPSPAIEVLFPPDLLDGTFVPFPHIAEDGDRLCVRGPFAIEGTPFMLPLTAMS